MKLTEHKEELANLISGFGDSTEWCLRSKVKCELRSRRRRDVELTVARIVALETA